MKRKNSRVVVRNSIDTIDTVSIPLGIVEILGIVTGIVTKNAKKKKKKRKRKINEITQNGAEMGQMSKKPKNLEKIRSPKVEKRRNKWRTYGCEVRDGDFRKDIWVLILLQKYRYYIDTNFRRYFPSLFSWLAYIGGYITFTWPWNI